MSDHAEPRLEIAFPKSETELRLVFSAPMHADSVHGPDGYETRSGLGILSATLDPADPSRVMVKTEPMNGEAMVVDAIRAMSARTHRGDALVGAESPQFIQGIASIPELQRPAKDQFPFGSRFANIVATGSCGKDGGTDGVKLASTFGFNFIHNEAGGPFNSIKVVTTKHIPGAVEAMRAVSAGQTIHVLWAGGVVQTEDGETRLVDTGYMEGSIFEPNPLQSPRPFPIETAEIAGDAGTTLRAKSLQGVIVRFDNVMVDRVAEADPQGLREIAFHDRSGGVVSGVVLDTVTTRLYEGQQIASLRGLIHQPAAGEYQAIIELDQHIVLAESQLFGHVILVEGYALSDFVGCHAFIALRDQPGVVVAALTSEHRLQTLLETALQTGNLIAFWGARLVDPPTPRGGLWTLDVYGIDGVIVYDRAF